MLTSQAIKVCLQRFMSVLVNDLKTTTMHARDGSVMKQVWSMCKEATVRGLMWCGSTNGKFVDCELNVASNTRRCLALSVWPAELYRVAVEGRLQKVVGKVIRCGRRRERGLPFRLLGNLVNWCPRWILCVQCSAGNAHGCFTDPIAL